MNSPNPGAAGHNWRCPQCESRAIAEVTYQAKLHTRVVGLTADGRLEFGPHTSAEAGTPHHYECENCGRQLEDGQSPILDRKHLAEFLKRLQG